MVHRWRQTMRQDSAAAGAGAGALAAQQQLLQAIGSAFGGGGSALVGSAGPEVSLGYGTASNRALSIKEKVDICNATERERIAFGKVGRREGGEGRCREREAG